MVKVKIVGAGLSGCSCACLLSESPLISQIDIYEKEDFIGGLCCDDKGEGIFQYYGPHIFHTSDQRIINFVLKHSEWTPFCNRPIAVTDYGFARLPISIETIKDIKKEILEEATESDSKAVFEAIIKDYSTKQWGKVPDDSITQRLKIYDGLSGSYFNDLFEGLPKYGFNKMFENMIDSVKINLINNNTQTADLEDYDYLIWTGPIDEAKDFPLKLKWCGTKFVYKDKDEFYPRLSPVYNLNSKKFKATRSTDMDRLTGGNSGLILEEIPRESKEKHYPIIDEEEKAFIDGFIKAQESKNIFYCGRSATANYLDMDDVISQAFDITNKILIKES